MVNYKSRKVMRGGNPGVCSDTDPCDDVINAKRTASATPRADAEDLEDDKLFIFFLIKV